MADIDIARKATLRRITELAKERLGIDEQHIEPIGHYKAKLDLDYVHSLSERKDGKLILVTAISPTPAGEGKVGPVGQSVTVTVPTTMSRRLRRWSIATALMPSQASGKASPPPAGRSRSQKRRRS